jgi:Ras family
MPGHLETWDSIFILCMTCCFVQHANEDVEKMILGNKCDMVDKRQVPRQKGEEVSL